MTSGAVGESEHFGELMCRRQNIVRPASACWMKPVILPPAMSFTASM